jgi:hypothetical protein
LLTLESFCRPKPCQRMQVDLLTKTISVREERS